MEVVNYIRDLLYHHDCVVVPGFGGFVTNERSARIDRASNSFYPPSRDVGFNAMLDHNDGLLISYISARLSINYVDARKMVESFTENVTRRLESGRSLNFEGIGNFIVDRQNNLHFEPDPSANFLTGAYGLSFFRFPALEDTMTEKRIRKISEEALTGRRRRARKLLRYAAIGIPLIAALTWGAMNSGLIREFRFDLSALNPFAAVVDSGLKVAPYESAEPVAEPPAYMPEAGEVGSMRQALMYEEAQPADAFAEHETGPATVEPAATPSAPEAEAVQPTVTPAAPEAEAVQPTVTPSAPEAEAVQPAAAYETAEVEAIQPAASRRHYIMAGSFRSMQNARIHAAKLELEGYNCQIIESEGGWFRVSPYSSDSGPEALQMLRRFRAEEGRSDYWLLSR